MEKEKKNTSWQGMTEDTQNIPNWLVVEHGWTTHLKNMIVKMGIFPK